MKNLNFLFKLLLLPFLIILFSASSYAITFEQRVLNGNDDAEESTSNQSMSRGSTDLELVFDGNTQQEVGIRFTNITIPNNATITNAYIQFTVDETDSGTTNVVVFGQDTDDAAGFSSSDSDISNRTTTSASVSWNIPVWNSTGANGADQRTPNLSTIVQEIVDRGGWSSGNDMAFIVKAGAGCSSSSCQRTAESYNGSSSQAALLHIEYTIGPPPPVAEYRMDQCLWDGSNGEVIDSVGTVNGTSFNGADTNTDHIVCRGAYFDGTDDYVSMGDSFNTIFGNTNDAFTITTWIKPESLSTATSNHGTANTFIAKASDSKNDNLEIGITPGGSLHLYLDTSGRDTQANFGSGITAGNWYFIAVTYDGSDVSVTINNSTTTDGRWSGNLDQANGSPFTIGTTRHIDTHFNGLVDEVKIYDIALSTTEINAIYANENAGNNYTGTSRTCQSCVQNLCTGTRGLAGTYYNNRTFTSPLAMSRIDSTIDFEWADGSPDASINDQDFSIEWTGTIYIPEDADYTFSLAHDDVMTLIIDGNTIYNNSSWTGGASNFNDATATHFAAGIYPITIRFVEHTGGAYAKLAWRNDASIGSRTIVPNINFCTTTPTVPLTAVDDTFTTPANTDLVENVFDNDSGTGYTISATDTAGLQGVLTDININTGEFTFQPTTNFSGSTSFTYTIDDGTDTSTATVTISVTATPIIANDDSYNTNPGVSIRENLMDNDIGVGIELSAITTQPAHGTVTIQPDGEFTYTPNAGYAGTDSFLYQITDNFSNTDEANVTITIGTSFTDGPTLAFTLINPDFSRNVIGDYKIAGNTVLCLTGITSGFGGTCHGDTDYQNVTSNMNVSKYLDIDNDSGTWNSTSSYVDLTNTAYNPERGVIWAGLFWGGRLSEDGDEDDIRYAIEDGSTSFSTTGVSNGFDITTTGATELKLKVDNGNYADILASSFHTSESGGGQTYAAFADVSAVLQDASLDKGKHVFTVANLTTMEGREPSPGAFGGWSLVVIYGEDYQFGKPRNISIYNGFIDIGENDTPIEISGFKLPTSSSVSAQLSIFSGEGEYLYGRNPDNNNADWMKISDTIDSGYDYMPGKTAGDHLGNRDNMFDAQLDGILRDPLTDSNGNNLFNDLGVNNVGVDIDNYDVSDLMTSYRDSNENISSIFIQTFSDNDYITPSMIAFSAELYIPELCYDYTLDIAGHVLDSVNNEIKTPFGNFGEPLTTVLYIKSLEGDIDLSNVDINYSIIAPSQLAYIDCTTEISEVGVFSYSDACAFTTPHTFVGPGTDLYQGFGMHIGKGKTPSQGGVISAFEDRYVRFNSQFKSTVVNTAFEFSVGFTVDYGSGAVPIHKIFTAEDMCEPTSSGFLPELGVFNITDRTNNWDKWNLYTQVSRRAFDLRLWAYSLDAGDYTGLIGNDLNLSLEVEPIRADNFSRDANTACHDEHSILTDASGQFLHFNVGKYIDFGYEEDQLDFSYRSVALRIWYLTDVNGTGTLTDDHNCTRVNQSLCVDLYDDRYASKSACEFECRDIGSSGNCYDCLRDNYGERVCSRDNFAIRPESFITELLDSNESSNIDDPSIHIANSVSDADPFSVVAGYKYRFDINATNHVNDEASPRYIQYFDGNSSTSWIRMTWDPNGHTVSGCNDVEDQNISISLFNGSDVNYHTRTSYTEKVTQIGKYRFEIYDGNWTSADSNRDEMEHHYGSYSQYYDEYTDSSRRDCATGSSAVLPTGVSGKNGCVISSEHANPDRTGHLYKALLAQYYPSQFLVDGLGFTVGPNGGNFLYINTLDDTLDYPDGYTNDVDENMSYNVQGTFRAAGFDNGIVSNFVDNCYAEDVNMSLYQSFQHTTPSTTPNLTYDLIDFNISDSSDIIRAREQGTFTFANDTASALPLRPLVVTQRAIDFRKDMEGAISMDLGYNFDRSIDTVLNPRLMQMNDFNISYATPPAEVYFQMKTDHKIYGNSNLDQNVSFFYGRVKPGKFFYEDITLTSINTPVSIVAYCDLGFTECQERMRILLNDAGTNEGNWWLSLDHRTLDQHGDIVLQAGAPTEGAGTPTVTPASPNALSITANATDDTVTVSQGANPTLPMTVEIDLQTNTASPVTDRWLIYNEYSNTVPSPFYKVRFIGDSNWTGIGDEGMVVGTEASKRKTKRLDW